MPEGLDKVDILMDYAGSDGSFIRFAVDRGARGIVVAGNLDPEKARVLLTLTLPIVKDDHQKLYRFFAIPK